MTKRTRRITLWVLAGVALAGLALPKIASRDSSTKAAASGGSGRGGSGGPVNVRAFVVAPSGLTDRITVTGSILPNEQIDLQSEAPGKIVAIHFQEGMPVSRGQLLVKINDADLRAQLARAISHKELAAAKEARQRQLRQKEAVSQAEYDIALSELTSAIADIDLIKAQIAKTEITAPFSGVIGLRQVSIGSYISPSTKIATLNSVNPAKLEFSVPEKYFAAVRRGSELTFTVQGVEGTHTARVYAVEPKIDQSTRSLVVRALAPNAGGRLFPGAFAEIALPLKSYGDALLIPSEAVVPELDGKKVFIARSGKAEPQPIEVGIRTDRAVQVVKGLAPGDTIVTSGILQVKPGSKLKISDFQKL